MTDIAIIGGGASGMMAACAAKRARQSAEVLLLERQSRVGRKLLATGNGRCNITNADCENPGVYNNAFASRVMARAGLKDALSRFREMGLYCVFDREGRAYPASDQASSVVDALRLTMEEKGVRVETGREVVSLKRERGGFKIVCQTGESFFSPRVIVACGGLAGEGLGGGPGGYKLLKALGHRVTPLHPALTQLRCAPESVKGLKGVKRQCEIALEVEGREVRRERGEVLFCDYGLSGIAAMALSRQAGLALARGASACAVLRAARLSTLDLLERRDILGKRPLDDFLSGVMPKRLGQQLLKQSGIFPLSRPSATLGEAEAARLSATLDAWRVPLTGVNGFSDAQVTCGGAEVGQFSDSLESRLTPGLYAVGELLDVDGPCGGFNLQWAWASGIVAGEACANDLYLQSP